MVKKVLVIKQSENYMCRGKNPVRGILTVTQNSVIEGALRVYNVEKETGIVFALKIGDKKFIFDDVIDPQTYDFKITGADINAPVCAVLAEKSGGGVRVIATGHSEHDSVIPEDLFDDYDSARDEIEDIITEELERELPHEEFVSDVSDADTVTQSTNDEREEIAEKEVERQGVSGNFYSLIKPQLDELFSRFSHHQDLENLVMNTEWIKVNYGDDGGLHYVLGKLYDGDMVTHLCYGIPSKSHDTPPPESLKGYCQWLPVTLENPDGEGYWVMYQNAETGENITL